MRLTLRTLLAYLDDTLEPAQTKLIGEKVAETPAAQELIARIKDVVRRRRLTTPPSTGPDAKIDASTVAEYIDSVLPPEQLSDVEEVCLGADVYLAEVAACHQILTVVLSEPVLVPPTARRRMYGLVRGREAIPYRRVPEAVEALAQTHTHDDGDLADEKLLLGMPLYSRQGPWIRRLVPVALILVLVLCLGGAIALSLRGLGTRQVPPAAVAAKTDVESANLPAAREGAVHAVEPTGKVLDPSLAIKPAAHPVEPKVVASATPSQATEKKPGSPATLSADATAQRAAPAPVVQAAPPREEHVDAATLMGLRDVTSILLSRRGDAPPWRFVRQGETVATGDRLVSLPGCQSQLALKNGMQLLLWGNLPDGRPGSILESMLVLNNEPDTDLDMTLLAGRIVLSSSRPDGEYRARIRFHKEIWEVTLSGAGSQVLMELGGEPDITVGPRDAPAPLAGLTLLILKGQARVKAGRETYAMHEPPGRAAYVWNNLREPQPVRVDELPDWSIRKAPPPPFARDLVVLSQRLAREGPDPALIAFLGDRNESARRLAVLSLAATDDLSGLLGALGDGRHQDVRIWAIVALRHGLARGPGQADKLRAALQQSFGRATAIVMELLHSHSEQQRQDPGTWQALIAYLTSDRLAIRELANWHLKSELPYIAAKLPSYDLAGGEVVRRRAFQEWKRYIPDGKLPPPPPSAQEQQQPTNRRGR